MNTDNSFNQKVKILNLSVKSVSSVANRFIRF